MQAKKPRPRILFVDDDLVAAEVIVKFLSERYEVETAANAEDAVASCRRSAPDLVLMDLMMPTEPSYEGDEAIRILAADPKTASIPIIIQTGFQEPRILFLMGQSPNIVGVLVKPFDLELLKRKIEVILGKD
jgi:CheY-like chemotaxis protein